MQQRRESTRPQLAAASGLSLVTVNKAVAALCLQGVLRLKGSIPSGGGRPVQLYAYNTAHAAAALFSVRAEQGILHGTLELADMGGNLLRRDAARFSFLQAGSLDDLLDTAVRRRKLRGIGLYLPPTLPETGLSAHLRERYGCPVYPVNAAMGLAEDRADTLTLYLPRLAAAEAAYRRGGTLIPCPALHLLPLPAAWETLDYNDNTLVEEMVSRLLHLLTAAHAPAHFVLHADFWTERLRSRIRFNLSTKLRGYEPAPQLHFRNCPPAYAAEAVRRNLPARLIQHN